MGAARISTVNSTTSPSVTPPMSSHLAGTRPSPPPTRALLAVQSLTMELVLLLGAVEHTVAPAPVVEPHRRTRAPSAEPPRARRTRTRTRTETTTTTATTAMITMPTTTMPITPSTHHTRTTMAATTAHTTTANKKQQSNKT